ncbi:MAG: hypothetical protein JSU68_01230 [Phycisphaerales bacterium]|nr:MAG: hypothetical protein JSU68_01230 [Phycisphaerales bacterium]
MSGSLFPLVIAALMAPPGQVNLEQPPPPEGFDCDKPIPVILPAEFPYVSVNTTCEAGNDYTNTCLGYYDEGEDLVYQRTVTEALTAVFTLDPLGTPWSAIAVDYMCPPDDHCLTQSTKSAGTEHETDDVFLEPGTYYVMVDTWPSPDCVPQFTLTIHEGWWPVGACCLTDGTCLDGMWPSECADTNGAYQGDWTECEPDVCPQPCRCGDIDGGGQPVDLNDFATFALCFGSTQPGPMCDAAARNCCDLNGDQTIDLDDFATLAVVHGTASTRCVPDCLAG